MYTKQQTSSNEYNLDSGHQEAIKVNIHVLISCEKKCLFLVKILHRLVI